MNEIQGHFPHTLSDGTTEDFLPGTIDECETPMAVYAGDQIIGAFDEITIMRFAGAQPFQLLILNRQFLFEHLYPFLKGLTAVFVWHGSLPRVDCATIPPG